MVTGARFQRVVQILSPSITILVFILSPTRQSPDFHPLALWIACETNVSFREFSITRSSTPLVALSDAPPFHRRFLARLLIFTFGRAQNARSPPKMESRMWSHSDLIATLSPHSPWIVKPVSMAWSVSHRHPTPCASRCRVLSTSPIVITFVVYPTTATPLLLRNFKKAQESREPLIGASTSSRRLECVPIGCRGTLGVRFT